MSRKRGRKRMADHRDQQSLPSEPTDASQSVTAPAVVEEQQDTEPTAVHVSTQGEDGGNGRALQDENTEKKSGLPDRLKPYQWKPGQSGNPKGRPSYRQQFEEHVSRALQVNHGGVTRAEQLAETAVLLALQGDKMALPEVLKRVWLAPSRVELTGEDGGPISTGPTLDVSRLDEEDIDTLKRIASKALQRGGE